MKVILAVCLISLASCVAAGRRSGDDNCFKNRPKVAPSDCCNGLAKLIDDAALTTCKAKYPDTSSSGDSDKKGRRNKGDSCVVGCYLNETSVYKNGVLDKATAVTVLGKNLDENLKGLVSAAVDTCLEKKAEMVEKFGDKENKRPRKDGDSKKTRCSREPTFLVRCVEMELFKNCPAGNKVDSADCTAMNTFLETCKPGNKSGI